MSLVVDASAIAAFLLTAEGKNVAGAMAERDLFAPQLLVPEVVSTLRGWVLGRRLDAGRAAAALEDFRGLDVTLLDMFPLVGDVWSMRDNVSAYDGMYVALARALGAPLLTLDRRLVAALPSDVAVVDI